MTLAEKFHEKVNHQFGHLSLREAMQSTSDALRIDDPEPFTVTYVEAKDNEWHVRRRLWRLNGYVFPDGSFIDDSLEEWYPHYEDAEEYLRFLAITGDVECSGVAFIP